jgi:hypothetical protein
MKKDKQKLLIDRRVYYDEQKREKICPRYKAETGKL